jgi:hypothetical protein
MEALSAFTILAPTVVSAANDTTAVDLSGIDGDALIVLSAAASAASSSMAVAVQAGDASNGSDAETVATFTALADAASLQTVSIPRDELGRYVRLRFSGETGTFSAAVSCVALGGARYMG